MPTAIIAAGVTDANSADIVLADGQGTSISIYDADGGEVGGDVRVAVELKDAAGGYTPHSYLTSSNRGVRIVGPGTWRARRIAGQTSVAVNRD